MVNSFFYVNLLEGNSPIKIPLHDPVRSRPEADNLIAASGEWMVKNR